MSANGLHIPCSASRFGLLHVLSWFLALSEKKELTAALNLDPHLEKVGDDWRSIRFANYAWSNPLVLHHAPETEDFVFNQTMLRIRNPDASLDFYVRVLGMTLLQQLDFPAAAFSLYFLGYVRLGDEPVPEGRIERTAYAFRQKAILELTHNWGTETNADFQYHNGNVEPRGFGHIGIAVPDVDAACARFESLGVTFVKRPEDGRMKGLAFISDPDGYWIEILNPRSLSVMT